MKRNLQVGGGRSRGLSFSVFTETELDQIHYATLEVLERTGIFVEDDEALDIFKDGGCRVDREHRVVRIPPHVVEDAIRSAPSKYVLCGRDPKNDFLMEPGRVAFTNFSEGIAVIDLESGEHRNCTLEDVATIARLNDYLPSSTRTRSPWAPATCRRRRRRCTTPRPSCTTPPSRSASARSPAWSAARSCRCAPRSWVARTNCASARSCTAACAR